MDLMYGAPFGQALVFHYSLPLPRPYNRFLVTSCLSLMTLDDDWVVIPSLIEEPQVYACTGCGTHLCTEGGVECKEFQTNNGRGFLVKDVINITNAPPRSYSLMTGVYTCEEVSCVGCGEGLGWQYTDTAEKSQRHKIGKCVLEQAKLAKSGWGKDDDGNDDENSSSGNG